MKYFAYGSNMNWQQMQDRCPSAMFCGTALLPDHRLAFTRRSTKRGCGVADALPEKGRGVWGVVYEISKSDLTRLDVSEGYKEGREKNAYFRREYIVLLKDNALTVYIYFADRIPDPPLPNSTYKNLILSGARHWHLPETYIHELEAIEVDE
jgi:gamma-glutamylcyclotransferase (GGCT)/AIG2-like uncharacterized protein YtfP